MVVLFVKNEAVYLVFPVLCSHYLVRYVKRLRGNNYCNSRRLKAVVNYVSTGALSQPFSPASGSVCPGSDIEFTCVGNSILLSNTRWEVTPDGGETPCVVAHNIPDEMDSCGPGEVFTSSLTGQTGLNYTSSLKAEDVPLSLNGTIVECVDGADLQTIGSATICIVGKSSFSNGTMHLYLSMTSFSSSSDDLQIMHTQWRKSCSPVMQPFLQHSLCAFGCY